jgi:hypothetical protein
VAVHACRRDGVSRETYHRWKEKYGAIEVSEARRLKWSGKNITGVASLATRWNGCRQTIYSERAKTLPRVFRNRFIALPFPCVCCKREAQIHRQNTAQNGLGRATAVRIEKVDYHCAHKRSHKERP